RVGREMSKTRKPADKGKVAASKVKTTAAKKVTAQPAARGGTNGKASAPPSTVDMVRDLAAVMERRKLTEIHIKLPDADIRLLAGGAPAGTHQEVAAPPPMMQA